MKSSSQFIFLMRRLPWFPVKSMMSWVAIRKRPLGRSTTAGSGPSSILTHWTRSREQLLYGCDSESRIFERVKKKQIGTTMHILRTHHVAIICSDYNASKTFYTQTLGLEVIAECHRIERKSYKLDLRLPDGTQIELFSFPDPPRRASYPEACGLRHLAIEVANIDEAAVELASKGVIVEPIRIDEHTGKRFTFFADPDGLPLELYER